MPLQLVNFHSFTAPSTLHTVPVVKMTSVGVETYIYIYVQCCIQIYLPTSFIEDQGELNIDFFLTIIWYQEANLILIQQL